MNTRSWKIGRAVLLAGALALPSGLARLIAADNERPGVVRITDDPPPQSGPAQAGVVQTQYVTQGVPQDVPVGTPGSVQEYDGQTICYPQGYCGPGGGSLCSILLAHNCFRLHKTKAVVAGGGRLMGKTVRVAGGFMYEHKAYDPVDPAYSDPRDSQVFSAQGYGVPVSVPLAPCVKYQYNYGWGVPSSRITRINSFYDQYYPNTWTTQAGNAEAAAANHPPVVAVPTDTTQFGFYYKRVPTWQPVGSLRGGTPQPWAARFAAAQGYPGMAVGAPCPTSPATSRTLAPQPAPTEAPAPSPTYAPPQQIQPPVAKPAAPPVPPAPGDDQPGVEVPEPPQ